MFPQVKRGDKLSAETENQIRAFLNALLRSSGVNFCVDSSGIHIRSSGVSADSLKALGASFDGGGAVIVNTAVGYVTMPFGGTITNWYVVGDQSGSIAFDILRAAAGAGVPTASIVGTGGKPALSSVQLDSDEPTGWTSTTLAAGDTIKFAISGTPASVKWVSLVLQVKASS
jgi:hypothetical protein